MSWNYRVVVRKAQKPHETDYYAIHEAYYDEEGNLETITENPVPIDGDSLEEVRTTRTMMLEAFKRPVIDFDSIRTPETEERR